MGRLLTLDFYRAVAVVSVFLYHVYAVFPNVPFGPLIGSLGVDIFFVLSGFLVAYTVVRSLEKKDYSFVSYMKRRICRIVPAYYVALGAGLLIAPIYLFSWMGLINIGAHLLFFHNFVRDFHGAILGVGWTLGLEMQFYILIPFIVLFGFKSHQKIFGLFLLSLLVSWGYKAWLWYAFFPSWDMWDKFIYSTQLPGRIDQFMIGTVLCYLFVYVKGRISSVPSYINLCIWLCSTTGMFLYGFLINNQYAYLRETPFIIMFGPTIFGLLVGVSLFTSLFLNVSKYSIRSFLENKFFLIVAKYSYGIYLWHLLIMHQLKTLNPLWSHAFIYSFVGTMICAWISYQYIEKPFLERKL